MPNKINPKIALTICPPFWPQLPPLGVICLSSFLLEQGFKVRMLDFNNQFYNHAGEELQAEWMKGVNPVFFKNAAKTLKQKNPKLWQDMIEQLVGFDVIGFSCYQSNILLTLELAKIIKSHNPKIKIILGGPEITRYYFETDGKFSPQYYDIADLLVVGEGERPLLDLLEGKLQNTACFNELDDLNNCNLIRGYRQINFKDYPRKNTVSLLLSRGCLKQCRFCAERLLYKKVRMRSIDNIIAEIDIHLNENNIHYFVFHDSMLNSNLSRLERLCDAIIEKFGKINWEAQMAILPNMSDKLLSKMKQSGCYNLFIGLESGCDETLFNMQKGFTSMEAALFFKKLHKAELSFGVSIIVGYPGETERHAEESLRFLIANKEYIPKIEQINPYVYYDGTDLESSADAYHNPALIKRVEYFVNQLREHNFKITNAFINNLVEK